MERLFPSGVSPRGLPSMDEFSRTTAWVKKLRVSSLESREESVSRLGRSLRPISSM
jgi:hypothetical protein